MADYIVQADRFTVVGEVGCAANAVTSGLALLLVDLWPVILPLISAVFYCRACTVSIELRHPADIYVF